MIPKRTKIFGMEVAIDPKVIVLGLIILAGAIYYFTSSSETPGASSGSVQAVANMPPAKLINNAGNRAEAARRAKNSLSDRGTLKLVAVDGSRGDIDPTLRLGLLERVKNVPPVPGLRNLFEAGGPVISAPMPQIPQNLARMMPQPPVTPVPANNDPPPPPPFTIPLKYYGFVKPNGTSVDGNRGLFKDGDNILIGSEGDVLEKQFLIVALTPNSARLEDTKAKQGQELPVTPEAPASQ